MYQIVADEVIAQSFSDTQEKVSLFETLQIKRGDSFKQFFVVVVVVVAQ